MWEVGMPDLNLGQLRFDIELVTLGVRAAGNIIVHQDLVSDVIDELQAQKILHIVLSVEDGFNIVFFKHKHLSRVVPKLFLLEEPVRTWAICKLFGWSEDSIGDTLGYSDRSITTQDGTQAKTWTL
jgi:hypothetical protein